MDLKLDRWQKGDRFSASHLNEAVDVSRSLTHIDGTGGFELIRTPNGTVLRQTVGTTTLEAWLCKVTLTPGGGLVDFSDERYWLTYQYINDADSHAQIVLKDDVPSQDTFSGSNFYTTEYPFVGTNLSELVSHTHNLADGTPVLVFKFYDHSQDVTSGPIQHWVFSSGGTGGSGSIVLLTQTGGSAGANPANWTYTATTPAGATLGTGLSPSFRESHPRSTATLGLGYSNAGTFTLVYAFEAMAPGSTYQSLQWNGTVLVSDWTRAH